MSALSSLRDRYLRGDTDPVVQAKEALAHANSNAGKNVYLSLQPEWTLEQASALRSGDLQRKPLWGVPVSIKDCFDLAGFPTSCGSAYYREAHGIADRDSAVAATLKHAGAVITGKTHLHQLAYGITGENRDFGECVQPRNARWLTGGSSSGAAASVQEGSALAAIGTDTGGSVRVPAALCGLAGYRSSIALQGDLWQGGAHLAASFDTVGWLYRDLADGPALANALFGLPFAAAPELASLRIGVPDDAFLHDCEPEVMATQRGYQSLLQRCGANVATFDATGWNDAYPIFAAIQAREAAALHEGHFDRFEAPIAERLRWGASLSQRELADHKEKWREFRERTSSLFATFDSLLLPCCPMAALLAGQDQTAARGRILRYTTPISLAGLPAIAIPGIAGGLQLAGPSGSDAELLALSAAIGEAAKRQNGATLHP